MLKAAIVLMLIATVVSLFSGLFFLVKDDSSSNRLVIALSVRVALAALHRRLDRLGFFQRPVGVSCALVTVGASLLLQLI